MPCNVVYEEQSLAVLSEHATSIQVPERIKNFFNANERVRVQLAYHATNDTDPTGQDVVTAHVRCYSMFVHHTPRVLLEWSGNPHALAGSTFM